MGHRYSGVCLFVGFLLVENFLFGQERRWSFTGSVGSASLGMKDVDDDNRADVQAWRDLEIAIPFLQPLNKTVFLSGEARYRISPHAAISLTILNFSKSVDADYEGPEKSLFLMRSVGSTDVGVGFVNFLGPRYFELGVPARTYPIELFSEIDVGYSLARAEAEAYGEAETTPFVDSKGVYRKGLVFLRVGLGGRAGLLGPVFVEAEIKYKVARPEKLPGRVRRFDQEKTETTSIEFDYSGFLFGLGLGVELGE